MLKFFSLERNSTDQKEITKDILCWEGLDNTFREMSSDKLEKPIIVNGMEYAASKYTLEMDSDGNIIETTVYKQEE